VTLLLIPSLLIRLVASVSRSSLLCSSALLLVLRVLLSILSRLAHTRTRYRRLLCALWLIRRLLVSTHVRHRRVSASSTIAAAPTASTLSIVLCMVDTDEATVEPDDVSSQVFSDNEKLTRCCSCPHGRHRPLRWWKIAQIQSRDFDWYHDPSLLPASCQYMWYSKPRIITASSTLPKR
jgi:hypothetical protein